MKAKVTVVGAGNVGGTLAQRLAEKNIVDVVLVDVPQAEGVAKGKALDIRQSGPICGYDCDVIGAGDYGPSHGSSVVVITAGVPRKPGMSRDDLLATNAKIVREVSENVKATSPGAVVIVVSNPLDAMCWVARKATGFPRNRIIGMAGALDAARMRRFLADELGVAVGKIDGMVLGGHGDTMVPLLRRTICDGRPVSGMLSAEKIDEIIRRTRNGGAEIVGLLKTGSAYYAPSAAAAEMVEAILLDNKKILPCSAYLEGEYGISGLFVGVPVRLGASGIEEIIVLELTQEERAALEKSAAAVRELVDAMAGMGVA